MKKIYYYTILFIFISFIPITTIKIDNKKISLKNTTITNNKTIGQVTIEKINLKEKLYPINSKENTIEKHVTILQESTPPSLIILAAHSGTGKIAYFERLDELKKEDQIQLIYKGKKRIYIIKEIWEEKKNGYININKENKNQLILTTCSPKKEKFQLIINCIEKEPN